MPSFDELPLHTSVKNALYDMQFHTPSPIQHKALPVALFGSDVIGQAKSGTGKTAVFAITAVEHVLQRQEQHVCDCKESIAFAVARDPYVLIIAPTREIAVQIRSVLQQISSKCQNCVIVAVIGGLPLAHDQKALLRGCHIVVGTPGRIKQLIEEDIMCTSVIRLLVLDEVDKLLARDFETEIQFIVSAVPKTRQCLVFSATFTPEQLMQSAQMMHNPHVVRVHRSDEVTVELVSTDDQQLQEWMERECQNVPDVWLPRIHQYYRIVSSKSTDNTHLKRKIAVLARLLTEVSFQQCIVFCNDKFRAEALKTALSTQGWSAACITGAQTQVTRLYAMKQFRSFSIRVLVSTDLTARGIDIDKVDFIVNLDLPDDPATYLHRVGRAGRFGGKGLAVTIVTEEEVQGIHLLKKVFNMNIHELPSPTPPSVRDYVNERNERDQNTVHCSSHGVKNESNGTIVSCCSVSTSENRLCTSPSFNHEDECYISWCLWLVSPVKCALRT